MLEIISLLRSLWCALITDFNCRLSILSFHHSLNACESALISSVVRSALLGILHD